MECTRLIHASAHYLQLHALIATGAGAMAVARLLVRCTQMGLVACSLLTCQRASRLAPSRSHMPHYEIGQRRSDEGRWCDHGTCWLIQRAPHSPRRTQTEPPRSYAALSGPKGNAIEHTSIVSIMQARQCSASVRAGPHVEVWGSVFNLKIELAAPHCARSGPYF